MMRGYVVQLARTRMKFAAGQGRGHAEFSAPVSAPYTQKLQELHTQYWAITVPRNDMDEKTWRLERRKKRRAFWKKNNTALYDHAFLNNICCESTAKRVLVRSGKGVLNTRISDQSADDGMET